MHECLNQSCELISSLKLTPKKFIQNFLTNEHITITEKRRKRGIREGWIATKLLLETIGKFVKADNKSGVKRWSKEFILKEHASKMRDYQTSNRS
ncbi:hypothetical protein CROQUDRAFT_702951 [Cronartium quercuum f. sp. fusiforme G11]|uniref:Uncharacterized protein n=1 Tax=Cronartium quercuum f. sp. fusiforme G11 TaxID=708437 RepID=A0A9P6NLB6_9BASI|nr:hypothetical protein CROQUDRAFT_702951 [Cronartium quercuum f. sp. fusiforme G11]